MRLELGSDSVLMIFTLKKVARENGGRVPALTASFRG